MPAAMQVGIVGFAGSGKTTIFNCLTGLRADVGFGSKERTNLGNIKVPDPRVEFLVSVHQPKKKVLAEIGFVDVAGPEAKSSESGLDAKLVHQMRDVDALVHVVRDFDNPALSRDPDAGRDLLGFDSEMILSDLMQVETRLDRLRKEGRKDREVDLFERLHAHLEADRPLRNLQLADADLITAGGYCFLSLKPCLALVNRGEERAADALESGLEGAAKAKGLTLVVMSGGVEAEIVELAAEDQKAFLKDMGLEESARDRFVAAAYAELDLISFLTTGPDECRAWTIKRGTRARQAAGKVHSDIERGFIRAEVIAFADFADHPSEAKCRELGLLRIEGKDYLVQDGDLMNFRFNV